MLSLPLGSLAALHAHPSTERWRSYFFSVVVAAALALSCRGASAPASFEGWSLEPSVGQAHLVMVVRVASVGQLTVVEGAKTDVAVREYRFQPIKRLKGIFQRDQLSMTASDLGIASERGNQAPPLKEGEFRLLILAQQQGGSFGCVSASSGSLVFDERVPLLKSPEDPLVGVVDTLIQVADARSRMGKANLLVRKLKETDGIAAVPLLTSLKLRADWAAAEEAALPALTRLTADPALAVRAAALEAMRDLLASRVTPANANQLDGAAAALRKTLESDEAITTVRLAAIDALGHLLALKGNAPWAKDWLIAQLKSAKTTAERTASATALSRISEPQAAAAIKEALAQFPLDAEPWRVTAYARAAVRLDRAGAEQILLTRFERLIQARQALGAEIEQLGRMRSKVCLPLFLAAAEQPFLAPADRNRLAWALGRLGDDRAVAVLAKWLRSEDYHLKEAALTSLENIDSAMAAREIRPLLKSEANLPFKLRMARLLARHEIADGYALATEHLADLAHTGQATLVLAALDDKRTTKDLSAIVAARPDRRWHAAALSGLAATGDVTSRKQLLEILADDRHPLAADAAEAAGLAGDPDLLPPLAKLMQSRNRQLAHASLVALRRYFSGARTSPLGLTAVVQGEGDLPPPEIEVPAKTRAAIAKSAAEIVADAYVDAVTRQEAFDVAKLLQGPGYAKMLTDLTDQSELEGTNLLQAAETELRRLRRAD